VHMNFLAIITSIMWSKWVVAAQVVLKSSPFLIILPQYFSCEIHNCYNNNIIYNLTMSYKLRLRFRKRYDELIVSHTAARMQSFIRFKQLMHEIMKKIYTYYNGYTGSKTIQIKWLSFSENYYFVHCAR